MDKLKTTKIDDRTIAVERTITGTSTVQYRYDELVSQRAAIQAQKDREMAQRDTELAQVDELLAEAKKVGVKDAQVKIQPIDEFPA